MLTSFLKLFSNRILVREHMVPRMVEYLKAELRDRGLVQVDIIPDSVGLIVVQEALRRAAGKEKDGCPRYGEFNKQVEAAADSIIAIFNDEENVDARIKNILDFNRVVSPLPKPVHKPGTS